MSDHLEKASYPCPVCHQNAAEQKYQIKGFNIVQCYNCSMVYVNPRIIDQDLIKIYTDDYFNNSGNGYENYELTAHLRIKTFERWYNDVLPYLKIKTGNVLDVGCAAGFFMQIAQDKGWNAEGIELESAMYETLLQKQWKVYNDPLDQFNSDKKYDLITLFDVLEHLPELDKHLEILNNLLTENGSVVLVTPDYNSNQRKLFRKHWFQFKPAEHIQYFSEVTLRRAIMKHNFDMVYCSPSGQYADTNFLYDRLLRYNFGFAAKAFNLITRITGIKGRSWYADTGSILAVLQKKT